MIKQILILFIGLIFNQVIHAQINGFQIQGAKGDITIDGQLNEEDWKTAQSINKFTQSFPTDTLPAETKTEVKVTYDDRNLYVGAICHDEIEGDYIIQSLKRDFSFPVNDAFAVMINPSADRINGFSFSVNPLGVQREGVLQNGGVWGVTTAWDNKWFSKVTREKKKWIIEMKIPFTSIRFNETDTTWLVNFVRNDLKRNESSSWGRIPNNFNVGNLSFAQPMKWSTPPKDPGINYAIIPSAIGMANRDFETETSTNTKFNAGIDGKLALSPSLNLDITLNPDFSQVEVDAQQINLTAYSLWFPERRNFFIENSDLFSDFGFRQIRPFYSRRIGLESGINIPMGGYRLSGMLDKNWRIGYMNVATAGNDLSNDDDYIAPKLFTVAALQRRVFKASNIGFIYVERNVYNNVFEMQRAQNNRVLGAEYKLASENRQWIGNFFFHSMIPNNTTKNAYSHASFFRRQTSTYDLEWNHEYVGHNYNPAVGFVQKLNNREDLASGDRLFHRRSFWRLEPRAAWRYYTKNNNSIYRHGTGIYMDLYTDTTYQTVSRSINAYYFFDFFNKNTIRFNYWNNYRWLRYNTNITGVTGDPLFFGTYNYNNFNVNFGSDKRRKLYTAIDVDRGSFYNGTKQSFAGNLFYRIQPYGSISMNANFHDITFENATNTKLLLFGPRADLAFNKKLFFTLFVQYNTQEENLNIFSKLQYRFAPMSDLFIVYNDLYDINLLKKNRALVVKFVYWLSK